MNRILRQTLSIGKTILRKLLSIKIAKRYLWPYWPKEYTIHCGKKIVYHSLTLPGLDPYKVLDRVTLTIRMAKHEASKVYARLEIPARRSATALIKDAQFVYYRVEKEGIKRKLVSIIAARSIELQKLLIFKGHQIYEFHAELTNIEPNRHYRILVLLTSTQVLSKNWKGDYMARSRRLTFFTSSSGNPQ